MFIVAIPPALRRIPFRTLLNKKTPLKEAVYKQLVRVWGVGPQSHPWEGCIIAVIRYPQALPIISHSL